MTPREEAQELAISPVLSSYSGPTLSVGLMLRKRQDMEVWGHPSDMAELGIFFPLSKLCLQCGLPVCCRKPAWFTSHIYEAQWLTRLWNKARV